jgi:membrane associated rhomboid family serine protease
MFVLLVIVNVLVFLHESNLGPAALRQFVWKYAFIPSKLGFTGASMVVRVPADLLQKISPMVTSQFLHAGSMHLLSNMVVLLFLGKKVEERIGSPKFLAFYLASGIAGNIVYAAFHLSSREPVLGASGAVAGVLAASLLCNPNGIVWLPGLPIFLRVWMFAPLWFISELLNAINGSTSNMCARHWVEWLTLYMWEASSSGWSPRRLLLELTDLERNQGP